LADRFASVLAAAAVQGQQGFAWYSGSSNPWDNPGGFVNTVGSSLASTVSAASTAPGSSSGSAAEDRRVAEAAEAEAAAGNYQAGRFRTTVGSLW
jgi:hypothetical protein